MRIKHYLIPESEWPGITHVLVTHGDPDEALQAVRDISQYDFID